MWKIEIDQVPYIHLPNLSCRTSFAIDPASINACVVFMKMMNINIHLDIFLATLLLIDVLHPLVGFEVDYMRMIALRR